MDRKRGLFLALVMTLILLLAACGGDDNNKEEQNGPEGSPLPAEWTPAPGEGPGPVTPEVANRPDPTNTPYVPPPENAFQDAAELARTDLSTRLNIAPDRITVLESDSSLFLDEPLECPELPDENQDVYYVYLQYERFIYPYQAYQSADAGAVVEACTDVLVDQEVLFVPTPDARAALLDTIKVDLEARGVDTAGGEFQVVQPMTWTDSALGCRVAPGEETTPVIIDGFLFVYEVGGETYEYHSDKTGERLEYCAPPEGYESADDLLAALQANEDLEVVKVEGETAAYNGLAEPGVLIEMTSDAVRVGLFDFDSNTSAREAAQRINASNVSHIYVAGNVLVVQEENNPQVYGALLGYAEEVRTPLLEEEAAPEGEEPEATLPPTPSE